MRLGVFILISWLSILAGCQNANGVRGPTDEEPKLPPNVANKFDMTYSPEYEPGSMEGSYSYTEGLNIIYVVDGSSNMADTFGTMKKELKRSIQQLEKYHKFHILFFASGAPIEMPSHGLVQCTDYNKRLAYEFVDPISPAGKADPAEALKRAFALNPEFIYLLSNSDFDKSVIELVKQLNTAGTMIHTISFLHDAGSKTHKQMAEQNNGQYRLLTETDLQK